MEILNRAIENIINSYENSQLAGAIIISVLLMVLILCVYEFLVYRYVSHRAFYNKSFNICIAILPFFIATIILCLQSNIVITLGTIGALAIIRFRTAVKDPVDMIYILWSIHIGIICGCQLYEVAVITSLVVTAVLLALNYIKVNSKSFCLVIHLKTSENEDVFMNCMEQFAKKYRIKSRNYSAKGMDYVIECTLDNPGELTKTLEKNEMVERFSLLEYDTEDIV